MNILYLTPRMKIGGEELSTLTLVREMLGRGHAVVVKGNDGPMTPEFRKTGAHVHVSPRPFSRTPAGLLQDAMDIRRLVREHDIDIIHVQSVLPAISSAIAALCFSGKARPHLIFHERGISPLGYRVVPRVFNFLVDCLITNSDHEAGILKRNGLRIPCVRIHNCNNASTPKGGGPDIRDELSIDKATFVIGIVGRLAVQKGHVVLLEAFRRVLDKAGDRDVLLVIVGDGPLRGSIEEKVQELTLGGKVILTGFRRDLERVYPSLDLLAVPSLFEAFGNVAVEASAWGIPVVASKVGGLPEAVRHGESGLLVPPQDPAALAEAIRGLLYAPERARKLGAGGEELASTYFTPKRVADEVEAVYEELMKTATSKVGASAP